MKPCSKFQYPIRVDEIENFVYAPTSRYADEFQYPIRVDEIENHLYHPNNAPLTLFQYPIRVDEIENLLGCKLQPDLILVSVPYSGR